MNVLSAPVVAMAGISLYVGLYHLLIFIRRPQNRTDLTFALLCFTTVLYDAFCIGLYNATSVTEGVQWQRAQFIALAIFVPVFQWFVSDYTRQKPGKVIYAYSIYYILVVIIQLADRSSLTFLVDQPSIKHIVLSQVFTVTYYEATPGLFSIMQGIVGMVASTYILILGIRYYKRGHKRDAMPLILAMGLIYATGFNDTMVSNGVYQLIYLIEYAYLAVILVMAYSLSTTIVETAIVKDELRRSEERFRSLVETINDWMWEVDANGIYTYASPKVRDLLGYEPEEVVGRTPYDFMPAEEAERVNGLFQNAISNREPVEQLENICLHKDGRLVLMDTNGVPFFGENGNLAGYRGIDRDITKRKLNEVEREALIEDLEIRNAELERFTYTISHDLKSPLVTINGFLGYLEKDAKTGNMERLKNDINRIQEAVNKMRHLLNDLLELSRIGRLVNTSQIIPFANLVQDALEIVHGQLEERSVKVIIQPNLPAVFGDRQRLTEVLQNLLDNASKFMGDEPNPQIEIGQRGEEAEHGKSIFFVKDNGIGIAPKYHEQVFGLFNKLNSDVEGTGIGLALVKRIIEVHGGRIWVESEVAKGSTFYFSLPTN